MNPRLIFITGTDTGVGKTVLTGLLLCHLRHRGTPVLALKPFCTGSRTDAKLLSSLQQGALTLDQINPFYFPEPIAPLVAARKHHRKIQLAEVLKWLDSITSWNWPGIKNQKSKIENPVLLVEGAGGLLAPLGEDFSALDLIRSLRSEALIVAPNRLGTINHTLLTLRALELITPPDFTFHVPVRRSLSEGGSCFRRQPASAPHSGPKASACCLLPSAFGRVVLMNTARPDPSCGSNPKLLSELLGPVPVFSVPFLGPGLRTPAAVSASARKLSLTLGRVLGAQPPVLARPPRCWPPA